MKELLLLAGSLGFFLGVCWIVIVFLEWGKRRHERGERVRTKEKIEQSDVMLPVIIMSAIRVYQEETVRQRRRAERIAYAVKEEKQSLWRTLGRHRN